MKKHLFLLLLWLVFGVAAMAQSVIPLPPHSSNFSGNSRGMWFTAPTDFVITGVRAPLDINTNPQSVHLVKFPTAPPAFSSVTTVFTTLYYAANVVSTGFIPLNIQVTSGDIIGVMAVRNNGSTGGITSYGATGTATYASTIGTFPVTLYRLGWQGNIVGGQAADFWTETTSTANLGRVELQYVMALPTDASLEAFVNVGDSMCAGNQPVGVTLKNNGPSNLSQAQLNWKVNNVVQTPYAWSGSLAVNATANVTIGSYPFTVGTPHEIVVWLSGVNNNSDSVQTNDTIQKAGIFIKTAPSMYLMDTTLTICQGDSAKLQGTLNGTPPWNFKLLHGTTSIPFTGVTNSALSYWVTPSSSTNYYFTELSDGTGCARNDSVKLQVLVSPQPPAAITPQGSPAACQGDSVTLMASVGLNFSYLWYKDGIQISGPATFVLHTKQGGNYTVQVMSPSGCKKMSPAVTVTIHPLPVVNLGNDTVLLPTQTVLLNAGAGFASYLWSTGATSQQATIDNTGTGIGVKTVWVVVTDNNGCKGSDTLKINFTNNPGISGVDPQYQIRLFPNPSDGKLTLLRPGTFGQSCIIRLFNANGSCVYSTTFDTEATHLDVSFLPNGIYRFESVSNETIWTEKIIIVK